MVSLLCGIQNNMARECKETKVDKPFTLDYISDGMEDDIWKVEVKRQKIKIVGVKGL